MVESPGGEGSIRATLQLGTVVAGTSRNLRSEIVAGNARADGAPGRIAPAKKITCQPVGGATLPNTATRHGEIWSGRDLLPGGDDQRLTLRMLVRPAATGDYECLLRAYVNNGLSSGTETASLRSGFIAQVDGPPVAWPVARR